MFSQQQSWHFDTNWRWFKTWWCRKKKKKKKPPENTNLDYQNLKTKFTCKLRLTSSLQIIIVKI